MERFSLDQLKLLSTLTWLLIGVYLSKMPFIILKLEMQDYFNASITAISMVLILYELTYCWCISPGQYLMRKIGVRGTIIVTLVMRFFGSILICMVNDYWSMFFSLSLCNGFSEGLSNVIMLELINRYFLKEQRKFIYPYVSLIVGSMNIFSAYLIGQLEFYYSWRNAVFLLSPMILQCLPIALITFEKQESCLSSDEVAPQKNNQPILKYRSIYACLLYTSPSPRD